MKRIISALVALMMVLSVAAMPVSAITERDHRGTVTFTLDNVEAEPDTDVNVSLKMEGEYSATALTVFVEYDSTQLSIKGNLKKGEVWYDILDVDGMVQQNTGTAGRIGFMAIVPDGDFSSTGTIFTMTFHVSADVEPGTTIPLALTVDQFTYDELNGNVIQLPYTTENGSVVIPGAPDVTPTPEPDAVEFMLDTVEADPDTDVNISLTMTGEYAATALTVFVDYDAEKLSVKGNLKKGNVWYDILDVDGMVQQNTGTAGRVGFMAIVPDGDFSSTGTVFTITLHVSADAEPGTTIPLALTIDQFTYDELSGNVIQLPHNETNGAVVIPEVVVETHTITYTVNGEEYATQTYEVGAAVTAPEYEVPEGYTFSGWDVPAVMPAEDLTLDAALTINTYTVTWKNWDGEVLQTVTVDYNQTPEYTGETPVRPDDDQYTYTFTGWDPQIVPATANATYTAQFEATLKGYHIYVTDYTRGRATTSIVAEQLYSGEVTFTVTCDIACAVAIDNGSDSYTRLTCTTENGEHKFTVTVNADVYIVVVVRGDVNFDGNVKAIDATRIGQAAAGNTTLTALQILAADLNYDGLIKAMDATKAKQVAVGNQTYSW